MRKKSVVEKERQRLLPYFALIPEGEENGITEGELADRLDLSKRAARKIVTEKMRSVCLIVINLNNGSGYFRPRLDEIEKVRSYYRLHHAITKTCQEADYYLIQGIKAMEREISAKA